MPDLDGGARGGGPPAHLVSNVFEIDGVHSGLMIGSVYLPLAIGWSSKDRSFCSVGGLANISQNCLKRSIVDPMGAEVIRAGVGNARWQSGVTEKI